MTTESKLHTAKSQMIYWSRRVSELTKQMERERAIESNHRGKPERKGSVAPRTAGGQRVRDDGAQDAGDGSGGL